MIVKLEPGEMAVAQHLGLLRRCVNTTVGLRDRRFDKCNQPITLEMLGTIAEFAFCKRFGAFPDLTVQPRAGGADVVARGLRWDIKATDDPRKRLVAPIYKKIDSADRYALAVVMDNEIDFKGWAYATELINQNAVRDLGHGPSYVLDQSELHRFRDEEEA